MQSTMAIQNPVFREEVDHRSSRVTLLGKLTRSLFWLIVVDMIISGKIETIPKVVRKIMTLLSLLLYAYHISHITPG